MKQLLKKRSEERMERLLVGYTESLTGELCRPLEDSKPETRDSSLEGFGWGSRGLRSKARYPFLLKLFLKKLYRGFPKEKGDILVSGGEVGVCEAKGDIFALGGKVGVCEAKGDNGEASSLFEAIRLIHSVIQPKHLPEAFAARVSRVVQERFQNQVSAEKIQRIIGMAVTMDDFRKSLFQDVVAACSSVGLSLTPMEIAALRNLKEDAIEEFANSLDERITKFFPANLS